MKAPFRFAFSLRSACRAQSTPASQRQVTDQIFLSHEKMVGLDGVAGAGKTTTLAVIREGADPNSSTCRLV